jgi:hypothetical protein
MKVEEKAFSDHTYTARAPMGILFQLILIKRRIKLCASTGIEPRSSFD